MADREIRVRELAYRLWEEAGRPDGRSEEFWRAAETRLAEATPAKAPRKAAAKAVPAKVSVKASAKLPAKPPAKAAPKAAAKAAPKKAAPKKTPKRKVPPAPPQN
ncbi:MAG: DUF2934 domain-containing protein [Chthoniobacter sp.]|nr:DUF2934 domain-containing protein [Chthoniobacter sp.]